MAHASNNPFAAASSAHEQPPTYYSRNHTASEDNASAYGGVSRPSGDQDFAATHPPSQQRHSTMSDRESLVFQGHNSVMPPHRHDSYISSAGYSELGPEDSISVVGVSSSGRPGGASTVHAYGGSGDVDQDAWRYEDPYASANQRSKYAETAVPRHQASVVGYSDEKRTAYNDDEDDRGRDGMLHPHQDEVDDYYHSRNESTSAVPLVLGGHRRHDSDSTTIVGSYKDGKRMSGHLNTLDGSAAYAPVLDSPQSPREHHDEEEGRDKYPPVTRLDSVAVSPRPPVWKRIFYDTTPTNDKVELHKRGVGVQERAWLCYILAFGMVVGLVVEMIRNQQEQGKPIATSPTFNYMIGPSSEIMINTGARFTPCMKRVDAIASLEFACLNATSTSDTCTTSLENICGFGDYPNQTFRFVLPIFLHAGLIHLLLNLFVQLTSSAIIERQMGSLKFLILFIPSGVFGFILGGNFSLIGQPSVGASGAIFGTHAAVLVDLIAHWGIEHRPGRKLMFLLIEIIVGLGLGLIPGIDNFAHIGGFAMGLLISLALLPMVHQTKSHRTISIVLRLCAVVGAVVMFVVLYRNFFTEDPASSCEWCRFLSCWPTSSNNHCKGTGLSTTTTSN